MKKAYLVYILLICFQALHSQERTTAYDNTPLKKVLTDIEERYDISISYNSKIVQGKFITLKKIPPTLSGNLKAISRQTNLSFQKITAKTYVLKVRKKQQKTLKERIIDLDKVIISEYLTTGFSKNIDGAIEAIPKDFQVLPGFVEPDVLQSVQLIPGIQSPDETSTGLNIRGGTPDQNLILWDHIKMYQYDHFFGMISSFNPYVIENVKIYKNAAAARYGNHISGVIDIQSLSKIPKKTIVGLGANMIYVDAFVQQPIGEDVAVITSFRRSYSDAFETVTFDEFSEQIFQNTKITDNNETFSDVLSQTNNSYYFVDFTAKIIANLSKNSQLTVSSIFSKNELDFESKFDEINQRTKDDLFINNRGIGATWKNDWTSKLATELSVTASRYNFEYVGEELLSNLFDYETVKKNKVTEIGLHFQSEYQLNKKHFFVGGYELIRNELDYTIGKQSDVIFDPDFFITSENSKNTIHAIFGEHHFKFRDWNVFTGIRGSYATELGNFFFEPRIHISKKLNEQFNLTFSAERQYQFISQIIEFETETFGLENQVWVAANDTTIPVLQSEQVSFGGTFQYNSWNIDAEAYYKKINNLTTLSRGFEEESNTLSVGESTITGLDVLVKKRFYNFTSLVSYALTRNDFQFDNLNNTNAFAGNFDIRHYLSLVQSAKFGALELSLGWRYRTSRPYTFATGLEGDNADNIAIVYGERNGERLQPYHRLDFSAKYELKPFKNNNLKASFGFSLLNIYNQKNILNRNYRVILNTENAEFQLRTIDKISLGRTPNFMVRLEF
ncbi:TonB-dependent receptor plug domain-containing protein [Kordia algicida OT-1]|uniref:Putative outer membrane protein probably involved in nutrient binding n=1 Tax=Kordia algicida OT-1 TaxID=391587 RepID=A9DND8_9FLAO|nr:TonB-dependent receptor plug domain-containing protein [Kordia algicida]EDP97167.1 putative outer membrane protein probably involved in nutrient binding [Kordia algicida OT-1]